MGKILVFVSIVFTLLSAGLGFVNKTKLTETKDLAVTAQETLDETSADLTTTKADLKSTTDDLATTNTEKTALETQISGLQTATEQAKNEATAAVAAKTTLEGDIAKLTTDLETASSELKKLQEAGPGSDAVAGGETTDETKALLAEKEAVIAQLQSKLDSSESQLSSLETEKMNRLQKVMKKGLEGRVLAVNPAWNFVVLNLGDKNGVVSNAELLVKRGTQLVGKVRITSVEPSTSIADIVKEGVPQGVTIAPGDNVIYQISDDQ
jgi:phage-related tail protein